jgi:hypothetical protein
MENQGCRSSENLDPLTVVLDGAGIGKQRPISSRGAHALAIGGVLRKGVSSKAIPQENPEFISRDLDLCTYRRVIQSTGADEGRPGIGARPLSQYQSTKPLTQKRLLNPQPTSAR